MTSIVYVEEIEKKIFMIRGEKVMLDYDLASLYGVSVKRLNEQVKRNLTRFPADFMFQLTHEEYESLRSQNATLKPGRGKHRKYLPYAFTEHGAIMLASVLSTPIAVEASIYVVRAFVRLRHMVAVHDKLSGKLTGLEQKLQGHDEAIHELFSAIRRLLMPPEKPARRIGFRKQF